MIVQKKFDEQVAKDPDQREAIMESLKPEYSKEIQSLNQEILKFAQNNTESLSRFLCD